MSLAKLTSYDILKNWRLKINELIDEVDTKAIKEHSSTEVTYGVGTAKKYGHLKLSDDNNASYDASSGIAASPLAVKNVYDIAKTAVQKDVPFEGIFEADGFIGNIEGNATTATLATKAIGDERGNNIIDTYATKSELQNVLSGENEFSGSIKRTGIAIRWNAILTDTNSSFLYQSTYAGYMPALNLQTQDGRVGFGTYQSLCRWDYFLNTNETNNPNSSVDLTPTGVVVNGSLTGNGATSLNNTLTVKGATNVKNTLTVDGVTNLNNDTTVAGNLTVNKNLTINESLNVAGNLNVSSLSSTGRVHGGAGSNFNTDLYVNSSSNSLIIRNDGANSYLLMSDTVGGGWNSLRPFSFNMSNGDVTMGHNLGVAGNIYCTGTITGSKVFNATFNDYAEFFEKGEETEAGDIIALDETSKKERYVKATEKSKLVVGIHSDTYGHILGGESSIQDSEKTHIPVGLNGRVFVKFVGKSILGEGVVPSSTPGVGRLFNTKIDDERKIVGYIVYDPEPSSIEERKVRVYIKN